MKRTYGKDLKVFANKGDQGFPNERKYIIDAKWWRNWCDYTGFELINQYMESNTAYESSGDSLGEETVVVSCDRGKLQLFSKSTKKLIETEKGLKTNSRVNMRYNQDGRLRKSDGIKKSSASLSARYEKPFNKNLELLREEIYNEGSTKFNHHKC